MDVKIGSLSSKPKANCEEIIKVHAKEGWRLHTFAPLSFYSGGQAAALEIIFEKEVK